MTASVSIIVEMDNLRTSAARRFKELLETICEQATALPQRVDVWVVHDPCAIPRPRIDALLPAPAAGRPHIVVHATSATYYGLKNVGARASGGDILVFLDSDVIPEVGALANLLAPFSDPTVLVTTGTAYIAPRRDVFDKAFALFWQFPPRVADAPPRPIAQFVPNCVAFRRDAFERFPFPVTETYRRGGQILSKALRDADIAIIGVPTARVSHPAPLNARAALVRALQEGFDRFQDRRARAQRPAGPVQAARGLGKSLGGARRQVLAGYDAVGLARHELPAALLLATAYEVAVRVGFVATAVSTRIIPALTGAP